MRHVIWPKPGKLFPPTNSLEIANDKRVRTMSRSYQFSNSIEANFYAAPTDPTKEPAKTGKADGRRNAKDKAPADATAAAQPSNATDAQGNE